MELTSEIDREIILAANQMPSVFWRPLAFVGLERDSLGALTETRRAFGHMCYYSLVVQLHLPYMLSPHDVSQRVYSKIACVNASREILTRQVELRMFNAVSANCRMSDFLSLIAGVALMLGHITDHGGNAQDHPLAHQRLGDRATVERALHSTDIMSDLHGDVLAMLYAALLRDLLAIEADAARQQSLRASRVHELNNSKESQRDILIVRVPYLGSIRISQGGVAALPAARIEQAHSLSEDETIGGIGSISIGLHSSKSSENDGTSKIAMQTAAPAPATYGSDLMFPDPAASFDDWVFQGVDTPFMESLMRGSSIALPDNLDDDGLDMWAFS